MGTKSKPAPNDCYARAEEDEPLFTLLARDPLAAHLVSIWAKVRMGDPEAARVVFEHMMEHRAFGYCVTPDVETACEANECSLSMFAWRARNRPAVRLVPPPRMGRQIHDEREAWQAVDQIASMIAPFPATNPLPLVFAALKEALTRCIPRR